MSKFIVVFGMVLFAASAHAQHIQNYSSGQAVVQEDQLPDWQKHMRWAWRNWDAGGSCDCPVLYGALGVPQYVVSGGRAAVMRHAAAAAQVNSQFAFQLVLLTQCHNPQAQETLVSAGQQQVLQYLSWLATTQLLN